METDNNTRLEPGKSSPLGAYWDGNGVNFSLAAPSAKAVTLCLFDETGQEELAQLSLNPSEEGIWSGYLPGEPRDWLRLSRFGCVFSRKGTALQRQESASRSLCPSDCRTL